MKHIASPSYFVTSLILNVLLLPPLTRQSEDTFSSLMRLYALRSALTRSSNSNTKKPETEMLRQYAAIIHYLLNRQGAYAAAGYILRRAHLNCQSVLQRDSPTTRQDSIYWYKHSETSKQGRLSPNRFTTFKIDENTIYFEETDRRNIENIHEEQVAKEDFESNIIYHQDNTPIVAPSFTVSDPFVEKTLKLVAIHEGAGGAEIYSKKFPFHTLYYSLQSIRHALRLPPTIGKLFFPIQKAHDIDQAITAITSWSIDQFLRNRSSKELAIETSIFPNCEFSVNTVGDTTIHEINGEAILNNPQKDAAKVDIVRRNIYDERERLIGYQVSCIVSSPSPEELAKPFSEDPTVHIHDSTDPDTTHPSEHSNKPFNLPDTLPIPAPHNPLQTLHNQPTDPRRLDQIQANYYNDLINRLTAPTLGGLHVYIGPHVRTQLDIQNEQYERQRSREAYENQKFLDELARNPDANYSCACLLNTIATYFAKSFGQAAWSSFDQRRARQKLITMRWPDNLTRNNELYRQFCAMKHKLLECEFNSDGSPKPLKASSERARQRAQILSDFFKYTLSSQAYHDVMQEGISNGIPYLGQVYDEELNYQPKGYFQFMGEALYMLATEPFKLVSNIINDLIGTPTLYDNINNHPFNKDTQQYFDHIDKDEYKEAFELLNERYMYLGNPEYIDMIEDAKKEFFRRHNEYGVPHRCANDPLFKNYPQAKKDHFKNNLAPSGSPGIFIYHKLPELHDLNKKLKQRDETKEVLADRLNINLERQPAYVDDVLYKIIDRIEQRQPITGILQELSQVSANSDNARDRDVYQLFFDKNGMCKLIGTDDTRTSLTDGITIDKCINNAENLHNRIMLNYFSMFGAAMPEKRALIRQGITYCSQACQPGELGQAYQKLATAQLGACVSNPNDPLLKCGNFATKLPTAQQQELQEAIVTQAATCVSSPSTPACPSDIDLGLVETARECNDAGDPAQAAQVLAILHDTKTSSEARNFIIINQKRSISPDGDEYREGFICKRADNDAQSPSSSSEHNVPKTTQSNNPPGNHDDNDKRTPPPPASVPPAPPASPAPPPAQPPINTPPDAAHKLADDLHKAGAHEAADNLLNALPKPSGPAQGGSNNNLQKPVQDLHNLAHLSRSLVPHIQAPLARLHDIHKRFGLVRPPELNPIISNLFLARDLAKSSQTNLPEASKRAKEVVDAEIDQIVDDIAQHILESTPENLDATLKQLLPLEDQLPTNQESYDTIKHLCTTAQWLYQEGLVEAGKQLAALAVKSACCVYAFGEGLAHGLVSGYASMYHMMRHPVATAKGLGKACVACARLMEYYHVRDCVIRQAMVDNRLEDLDQIWRELDLPEHLRETEQMIDQLQETISQKITDFIQTATLEDWIKVPASLMGECLAWHYNFLKIAKAINSFTGAGAKAAELVDRVAQSLIAGGLNERLIANLEEFGASAQDIADVLEAAKKGGPELQQKVSNLVKTLAERVGAAEQSLIPATVAQKIKNVAASGESLEPLLEEIGQNLSKVGLPEGMSVAEYLQALQAQGLTQEQAQHIAQSAYMMLTEEQKASRLAQELEKIDGIRTSCSTSPGASIKKPHTPPTAILGESINPTKCAEELKSLSAAGKPVEPYLKEVAENISTKTIPEDFNFTTFKRQLKKELVEKCGLDEATATKHVETLLEQAHEELLARNMPGVKNEHLTELANEIGEINYKRAKQGEKIDFSKYNLSTEERQFLEKNYDVLRNTNDALNNDGPLGRLIRTGVKGGDGECQGSWYELYETLEIKKENSEVVGLSKHHGIGGERKHTREFDIETSSKLIECKNIQWPDLKNYHNLPEPKQKYIDKLKSTFIQQKKIAESLGKEFEIRSAPAIPQEWQKFLNEHAIKFIERCIK